MQDERTEPNPASPDALWQRYRRDRDPEALDALVRRYSHLAAAVAGGMARACPPSIDREDLYAAALDGLAAAVQTHDPGRGPWAAWARLKMRLAAIDYLRTRDHRSREQREASRAAARDVATLAHRLGRRPTQQEIEDEIGPHSAQTLAAAGWPVSLDSVVGHKPDDSITLADTIRARNQADPLFWEELPKNISPFDAVALYLYYAVGLTHAQIGRLYRLSENAILARIKKARAQLRDAIDTQPAAEARP